MVRKDPGLIAIIGVGFLLQVAAFAILFLVAFGRAPQAADFRFPGLLWIYPIFLVSGLVGTVSGATVIAAAVEGLEGRDSSIRNALRLVLHKLPKLIWWNLVVGTVGVVLQLIAEKLRIGGRILSALAGVGWAAATMLVVPVLLYEDRSVSRSIERSASLIKKRWGEGVVGYASVVVALAVTLVPIMVVGAVLVAFSPTAGIVVMAASGLGVILVGGTIGGVFSAALYRFAADGIVRGPFERTQLEQQFRSKADRRRDPAAVKGLRVALWLLVLVTVGLRLLSSLLDR